MAKNGMMAMRLHKEMQVVLNSPGLELNVIDDANNIWHVGFSMPEGTVYAGESFVL